ncbi:MAG: hypothetical protein GY898_07900 [Proteobacteria bacterium]|nr:hypothetical protein [Pseudomonadota bacterium]
MKDWVATMKAHPVITGFTLACCVVGVAASLVYLPSEWSTARKVAAGLLSGAGCSLLIVAPRVVGQ